MYEGVNMSARLQEEAEMTFQLISDYIRNQTLSPFLFVVVIDELTKGLQDEVPWCILFADDVMLIDSSRGGIDNKLEL